MTAQIQVFYMKKLNDTVAFLIELFTLAGYIPMNCEFVYMI